MALGFSTITREWLVDLLDLPEDARPVRVHVLADGAIEVLFTHAGPGGLELGERVESPAELAERIARNLAEYRAAMQEWRELQRERAELEREDDRGSAQ